MFNFYAQILPLSRVFTGLLTKVEDERKGDRVTNRE
jgi:hypothetical protein